MAEEVKSQETEPTENTDAGQEETKVEKTQETQTTTDMSKQVEEERSEGKKEALREVSKQLGVNVFDEKEFNSYIDSQKNKVDKTELEKVQQQAEQFKDYKSERDSLALENAMIKNKVADNYQDKVKKLVEVEMADDAELTHEKAVEKVITDMPFLTSKTRKAGVDVNDDTSALDGTESYMQKHYYKDPKTGQWRKK